MESNEQNKQTKYRNRLTAVRGERVARLGEKGEEIKQKENLIDTDSMVVAGGKGCGVR